MYLQGNNTCNVAVQPKSIVSVGPSRSLAYFTDLNPADNTKFIEARVYRKWIAMKVPSLIPTGFSCILLDKKGSAIQANADLKEKERFDHDLQLNCVYRIQGFGFDKTDTWGKTLDNDFSLCFGKHTQVDLLKDDDYPFHYFNFAAYNELGGRLEKKSHTYRLYWTYGGQLQLSATSTTSYYFNPPVQETTELLAACSQGDTMAPQLELQKEKLADWQQERTRNRVALGTLLQIDPNTQQRVLFTQEVMILRIDNTQDWYYQKCDECGGKLRYGFIHGHCHPYGTQPKPEKSYSFRVIMTDGTGNATMTCFSPQTDGLIKDVNTLLEEVADKDPQVIPPQISALENTRHVFQFRFAKPVTKGPPTFVLTKVMDQMPAILPAPTASPSSPQLATPVNEIAAQHTLPTESPSSPPPVSTGKQTSAQLTPPPTTPSTTEDTPIDATSVTHLESSSTVRKNLFHTSVEKQGNRKPKKQKKE
ncbi:Replication protein A 70 kDa DNA-binding subunit B [Artemisia annua]|uniref:Replication protein A 70 kDa DNA-binding subunit B n=1 Tax=Artemisia annua TaxID=35608 RepID=A0A2U1P7B5_ARTAN|nr:Replication protein A 70 kDa DNA-binding subunit B [Artemisia annua]